MIQVATKWSDASSYSIGERGRIEPTAWRLQLGPCRVTVHRLHKLDGWFVTTVPNFFDRRPLKAPSVEDARVEALLALGASAQAVVDAATAFLSGRE